MKLRTKIIIAVGALLLFMMLLPMIVIKAVPDWAGLGFLLFSFFVVEPLVVAGVGILAGTDVRRLWWLPLFSAAIFPLLFGVAVSDFVLDLYFYSAIYLIIGYFFMLITHFIKKIVMKNKTVK